MRLRLCLAITALVFSGQDARANFLEQAWGILTDPLKIEKGTENVMAGVERTLIHLERMQNKMGEQANALLDRVDKTLGETRRGMLELVDHTGGVAKDVTDNVFVKLEALKADMMRDVREVVKCTSEVTLFQAQTALAKSLNDLGRRQARIEIWGWRFLEAKLDPQDIENPISAFREVKALYEARLGAVKPEDPPAAITDIYGEMQRLADLTRCHYKEDTGLFDELYWLEIEYNRLERPWRGKVKLL